MLPRRRGRRLIPDPTWAFQSSFASPMPKDAGAAHVEAASAPSQVRTVQKYVAPERSGGPP